MERSIKDTMRSEKEMFDLLISTAREDERILAAYLEGSRTVPGVPKDIFQDYDLVYVVKETRSFIEDRKWIDRFGERLYMQYPDDGFWASGNQDHCYGWLMQLRDGNRLDLHVCTPAYALENLELYRTLLDKDGLMPGAAESSDEIYWISRPTAEEFRCVCNEFWWCLNNVAKGLWRGELPYVLDMTDFHIRPMLKRMLEWKIGCENNFSVSAGKAGKYMNRFLTSDCYERFLATYGKPAAAEQWQAVFAMCDLFQETALEVAGALGFSYDREEAGNSRWFLEHVKNLPRNAAEIIVS